PAVTLPLFCMSTVVRLPLKALVLTSGVAAYPIDPSTSLAFLTSSPPPLAGGRTIAESLLPVHSPSGQVWFGVGSAPEVDRSSCQVLLTHGSEPPFIRDR